MVGKLSQYLQDISSTKLTIFSSLVFFAFTAFVLPVLAEQMDSISSGLGTPDTLLFYGKDKLYTLAEVYGAAGRSAYITTRIQYDIIWPIVYTAFLVTSIGWCSVKLDRQSQVLRMFNIFPLLAMIFDFVENISVSLVMAFYPEREFVFSTVAQVATPVKWLFVCTGFALLSSLFVALCLLKARALINKSYKA